MSGSTHTISIHGGVPPRGERGIALAARLNALRFVAILAFTALLAGMLASQAVRAGEVDPLPFIEVTAEAEAKVAPDLALLDFGVTTRAETAAAAATQNSERMKAVLAAVRQALGPKAQIGTGTYTLHANYTAPRDGSPPQVTGYTASNVVRLETGELARLGEVIDAAIKAGANQVQRIAFSLTDPSVPRRRALRDAVLDARSQAEALAGALEVKLGAVHSVVEQEGGSVRPFMQDAMIARTQAAAVTPIEPGLIAVRSRVVVRFRIAR